MYRYLVLVLAAKRIYVFGLVRVPISHYNYRRNTASIIISFFPCCDISLNVALQEFRLRASEAPRLSSDLKSTEIHSGAFI